jgi:hypothetical protein
MTKTQIKQDKYNKRNAAKTAIVSKTIGTTPPIFIDKAKYVVGRTFMLETEYDKMHNLSYNEPAPYPTRLTDADVKNLPYNDSDAGFFIAALHRINNGLFVKQGFSPTDAGNVLLKYNAVLVEEDIDFDIDTLDTYVKAAYPDLRKCINNVQQNIVGKKLSLPNSIESSNDYRIEMVELFKKRKIRQARTLVCSQAIPEEIESIYKWMYDNIELFGDTDDLKDQAIIIIKQGLIDHTICADSEINLAATLIKLERLQRIE